ncbi:hypothetical protein [Fodinicola feengrottensis]|uniref:hypothetical protein n=1 Tax=Fodinicola feengrottensis TaxID=435914 RepID=UPI0013D73D91
MTACTGLLVTAALLLNPAGASASPAATHVAARPAAVTQPMSPADECSTAELPPGACLFPGKISWTNFSYVQSANAEIRLTLYAGQWLVVKPRSTGDIVIWNAPQVGSNGRRASFQSDGNLAVYNSANQALWASNTSAGGEANVLDIQNDHNVVIYQYTALGYRVRFATNTNGR